MKTNLYTSLCPLEVGNLFTEQFEGDLLSVNTYYLDSKKQVIFMIFTKQNFRLDMESTLILTIENTGDSTKVEVVITGGDEYDEQALMNEVVQILDTDRSVYTNNSVEVDGPFQTMYFSHYNQNELKKEYSDFISSHTNIIILDKFEEVVKDEQDYDTYTIFITYIDSNEGNS